MTEWLRGLSDRREPTLCQYSNATLVWAGLLMYLSALGTRRQIAFRLNAPRVSARLGALGGQPGLGQVPHGDTVERYLAGVEPDRMQQIPQALVRSLLEARRLESYRLLDCHYLVTVDMTGHLYLGDSPSAFTEGCLTQRADDGGTLYYRPVCEAKLVSRTGLALSIGSEFVENPPGGPAPGDTQDSELEAAGRLFPRLKAAFGGYGVCALLDSRYANQTGLSLCEANGWSYMITLKEGSLPSVWQEFQSLLPEAPENRHARRADGVRYEYGWINAIAWGERRGNVLECRWTDAEGQAHRFVWLTDIPVHAGNVHALAQEGGRQRWRTENEGFRAQKHGGLEMEHAYAKRPTAAKNFYLLLQTAHILSQMLEVYLEGKAAVKRRFGALANVAHALRESLRCDPIPPEAGMDAFLAEAIHIRFKAARPPPGTDTS